jgi:hypothetical protein
MHANEPGPGRRNSGTHDFYIYKPALVLIFGQSLHIQPPRSGDGLLVRSSSTQEANMASHPRSEAFEQQQQPHAAPYCNDPNCEHCRELQEMQELIRLHESPSASAKEDDP